ncbi:restriction endonuclease subunit S [Mammaliicoccus sciuri]
MEYKVENLIDSVSKKHTFPGDKIIFLNTSDIEKGYVLHNNYSMIDSLPGQAKKSIQKGDILYSEIRPKNERFAYINFASDDYVVSTKLMVLRNKKPEILNTKYFYLYITSKKAIDYLQNLAESRSGTFPQITFSEVKNMVIDIPTLAVQNKIVNSIESIDKKIELNKKIIANLEELSQTLFKRWFVDFEFPDENGNPYKSSGGEMVDSELGGIPEFWKISKLEEIIDYSNKSIDVEKSFDKLDYIGLEHIPKNNKISINNWEDSSKIKGKKTLVSKGDILFGKLRPYFQKVGISPINGVVSTDILVIRPKKEVFYYFLLIYISQNKFIQYTTNTATGTRMPRTGSKQINTYKLILPPVSTLELFNTTLKNITINILQKNQEIRTLEILRDTLLPKLMSGEIEIPDDIEVNEDELSI